MRYQVHINDNTIVFNVGIGYYQHHSTLISTYIVTVQQYNIQQYAVLSTYNNIIVVNVIIGQSTLCGI